MTDNDTSKASGVDVNALFQASLPRRRAVTVLYYETNVQLEQK